MSASAISKLGTCLREARKAAGFSNYGQAGVATHRSPEVVGRHERGDIQVQMEDAIEYAEAYDRPEILMAFCDQCTVRERLFGACDCRIGNLPLTAIRLSNRLRTAERHAEQLEGILDDGRIDTTDLPILLQTLDYLKGVETIWRELLTICMSHGLVSMKKAAPPGKGSGCHQNHSSQQP